LGSVKDDSGGPGADRSGNPNTSFKDTEDEAEALSLKQISGYGHEKRGRCPPAHPEKDKKGITEGLLSRYFHEKERADAETET
jgi:hypothetical protein